MAQFHATQDTDGDTIVFDTNDQEVRSHWPIRWGRDPPYCPSGSFYVSEVQTDKTELVLTDCATNQRSIHGRDAGTDRRRSARVVTRIRPG